MTHSSTRQELNERIKELTCLYDIASVFNKDSETIELVLEKVCNIVKAAWKYHEQAVVELNIPNLYLQTSEVPTRSVYQVSSININGRTEGYIKVHYPAPEFQPGHFLNEEQKLLNMVGLEVSGYLENKQQKEEQEKLKRTIERNDRLNILGEITAGIAHELNTPLGNILGFAELIEDRTDNDQVRKDSTKIIKAAIYSREVVKKLMFFACEMPQNRRNSKIGPIVSQALTLLQPNFKKARVEYILENHAPELEAQVDPIQLTQVLFNLLINALHASPKGSRLKVIVDEKENYLVIKVCDEGSGISEEDMPRIFEPFFTTRPVGEGSGLGLSVVHGIVKSHKGKILVSKNQPRGTIFEVLLPVKF